ncbi:small GTP-binding protein [Tritrichomonas foetus]|uniref:Small GTP-binding protein n=1 Tax=Tritrichomonas foetus TaxID=1144522 RepID=A0A1J4K3I2_9EUKA|nr:small GTP-binding protein [Tritrichomonas foetus]|eukprot:OHT05392.1 small GTP-binding protein [Tritrichomonas foetus]
MRKAKVVLVGSAHTGKTSIVNRFVYGEFSPHTTPSTQPAFFQKKVNYNGTEFTLEIWDTAGQEQYHALSPMYYRDADAGIVVFDLTDMSSFAKSKQWVSELRQARGDSITIVVAGNKSDLQSIRTVKLESISQFAQTINAESFETSAKTGENIGLLFSSLVKQLSTKTKAPGEKIVGRKRSSVRFEEKELTKRPCC